VGLLHAAIAIDGRTDGDDVVIRTEEIAASNLDYLALGHWHSTSKGKAGKTAYAYSGAPEPIALDQDRAGNVLLVTLDAARGAKSVEIEERRVGRTTFERRQLDAATIGTQPALVAALRDGANRDLVLDVELIGVRPDELDLHVEEVEAELADEFLKVRVRDRSVAPLPEGPIASADTVLGAFIRDLEARVAEVEAADDHDTANELRDALRLGRLLLAGAEVTL
jgi:DNA repair exonuclease SbcCD nuclease subunit